MGIWVIIREGHGMKMKHEGDSVLGLIGMIALALTIILIKLGVFVAICYVAYHFLTKYW
jgi:hypothetical protein